MDYTRIWIAVMFVLKVQIPVTLMIYVILSGKVLQNYLLPFSDWLCLRFAWLPRVLEFYQNFYDLNQLFFLLSTGKIYEYNFRHKFSLQDAKYNHSLTNRRPFAFPMKRDNNRNPTDKGTIHAWNNFQYFYLSKWLNILMRTKIYQWIAIHDLSITFFWLLLSELCLHITLEKPEHTEQFLVMWHCNWTA